MYKVFLILLILFSSEIQAQNKKLDSLYLKLSKAPYSDTIYTKTLIEITVEYIKSNNQKSKKFAFQSLHHAQQLRSNFFIAKSLRSIGDVYLNVVPVNYDSSKYFYDSSLKIFKKLNEKKVLPEIYFNLGLGSYYQGDSSACFKYFDQGIFVAKDNNDINNSILLLRSKGVIRQQYSNYFEAIKLYNEALPLAKKIKDQENYSILLSDLSTSYFMLSRFKESINYALQNIELNKDSKDKLPEVISLTSVALSYKKLFDFKSAERYFNKALKLIPKIADKENQELQSFSLNMLLGNLYNSLDKYQKADSIYSVSKKFLYAVSKQPNDFVNFYINKSINDYELLNVSECFNSIDSALKYATISKSIRAIGRVYQRRAETILSELEVGKFNLISNQQYLKIALDSSLLISKIVGDIELQFFTTKSLAKFYAFIGNYKKAYLYKDSSVIISDSLFTEQKRLENQNRIYDFEFENQKLTNELKLSKEVQKRNLVYIGFVLFFILVFLFFLIYKRRRDFIEIQNELLNKAKITETELRILRLQLNPHFLFNSLNSIADYVRKNNIEKADYYLVKFAKLMRNTLESSESKEIPLGDEIKMIELYIQLESLRFSQKLTFNIHVSNDINLEEVMVPPLILQPFVENSIWHGLSKKNEPGNISISINTDNNMLVILIDDNGVGRQRVEKTNTERKSFGLGLTQDRIDLLNKTKNSNATVNLYDLSPGTRVELKLPILLK
jgi:tetratricopeptide (TPR) repeat protein